jgi:uncharacterized membrane protein YraQ (UPF0718 family)
VIIFLATAFLYGVMAVLLAIAYRKRGWRGVNAAWLRAWREFVRLVPRLAVGVIGAGFLARLLPEQTIVAGLGPGSGFGGVALAVLAGAATPGGPVVGYSIGAAALKAGAGLPQIMAYVTGWSLYTLQRTLVWEFPYMPAWIVRLRILVSLPFPFLIAALAMAR